MYLISELEENPIFLFQREALARDCSIRAWCLSNEPSQVISSSYDFNSGKYGFSIIDQFDGRQPYLYEFSPTEEYKSIEVEAIPTILLDSNMLGWLSGYIKNDPTFTVDKRACVRKFLKFVIDKNYDYNLTFYYIESAIQNGLDKAKEYGRKSAATLLKLQTMDERVFLETNQIVPDRNKLREQSKQYDVFSTEENIISDLAESIADATLGSINETYLDNTRELFHHTYAALLKIVLIDKSSKRQASVTEKLDRLREFLERELSAVLGLEFTTAAYYFSGLLSGFIEVELSSEFTKVKQKIYSAARDLWLLRMPQTLLADTKLANNGRLQALLSYICTTDKAVCKLGKLNTLEGIALLENPLPTFARINIEELLQELDVDVLNLLSIYKQRDRARLSESKVKYRGIASKEELLDLVIDLEEQIKAFCRK